MKASKRHLEARLENWAECFRVRVRQGKSATAIYCDRMRESRTGSVYDEPQPIKPPLDEDDADTIEYCVRMLRTDSKDFIKQLYVFRATVPYLGRRFGFRVRPDSVFKLFRNRIEQELQNVLDGVDKLDDYSRRRLIRLTARPSTKGRVVSKKTTEDVD